MSPADRTARELLSTVISIGRTAITSAQDNQVTFLAAAVAYYAFVSLIPLLALTLVVAATIGGRSLVERALDQTGTVLTPEIQDALATALIEGTGRLGATIVGSVFVLWGSLRVFRGIDKAFSQVYGTAGSKSIFGELRDGALVLTCVGAGIGVMATVGVVLRILPLGPLAGPASSLLVFASLVVVFMPMYYVFPDVKIRLQAAFPGAVFAALGWTLLGAVFSIYLQFAGTVVLYGLLGGVLLLVTLLYAGSLVLILGAVVNATLDSDRQVQLEGPQAFDNGSDE